MCDFSLRLALGPGGCSARAWGAEPGQRHSYSADEQAPLAHAVRGEQPAGQATVQLG